MFFKSLYKIYFIVNLLSLLIMLNLGQYIGDFRNEDIKSKKMLIIIFLVYSIVYYFLFKFMNYFSVKRIHKFSVYIPRFKMYSILIFGVNLINMYNPLIKANANYRATSFSFLYNLVDFRLLTYIYYLYYRKKVKKISKIVYLLNIFLYIVIEIKNGWSGFVLFFLYAELYFIVQKRKKPRIVILTIFSIIAGGILYKLYQPLKFKMRGLTYTENFNYIEGVSKFISRLNNFVNVSYYIENYKVMTKYLLSYINEYRFLSGSLQQIIPYKLYIFIFKTEKSMFNLNTLFANYRFHFFESGSKIYSAFEANFLTSLLFYFRKIDSAILYICFIILILLIFKVIIDFYLNISKEMQVIVFVTLHTFIITGLVEGIIIKSYKLLVIIVLFSIIKLVCKGRKNV